MYKVNWVGFLFLICSLRGNLGSGGYSMYLVGVCFGESCENCFTWFGFPCCLELDCAGDVLVVFYFYLGVGNYLLCYVDP